MLRNNLFDPYLVRVYFFDVMFGGDFVTAEQHACNAVAMGGDYFVRHNVNLVCGEIGLVLLVDDNLIGNKIWFAVKIDR